MTDPAAPPKPKSWPLIAITLLVVLLAGFLFVKWNRRDVPGPAVVKNPPPVEVSKPDAANPEKPAPEKPAPEKPAPEKPVPPPNPAEPEFERRVKELQKALQEKKWDAAAAALEAARKLKPDAPELKAADEALAAVRKQEQAEKEDAARKAALRQKQEREWAVLKEQVEKQREQSLWDAALSGLDAHVKQYPEAQTDEMYLATRKSITDRQKEGDGYYKRDMAAAVKHLQESRYAQALGSSEAALIYYPERGPLVKEFQVKVREAQDERSMVRIPSTVCWIGSDDRPDEKPLRQVKLTPFLMDKYEVTNEDYAAFCAATKHDPPPYWAGGKPPKGRDRHPVVFVTYDDATAYATWAGKRLPTAEEWEVAARGPDKREYPWGNTFLEKEDKFPCNSLEYWQVNKNLAPGTLAVDDKNFEHGASLFGVFGMGGNVWEWTSTAAPATGSKPPPEFRILKGGSFMTPQKATRCANVYAEDPRLPHPDVGFRCVRDVK